MTTKTITLISRKDAVKELRRKNFNISSWAEDILKEVTLTDGIKYDIVIVKPDEIEGELTTKNIRNYAESKGYQTPPAEVGVLLRLALSDEEIEAMGLIWIVTMHEPINDSDGDPGLLDADRGGGGRWLSAFSDRPANGWHRGDGFAFAVSQITLSSDTLSSFDTLPLDSAIKIVKDAGYKIIKVI